MINLLPPTHADRIRYGRSNTSLRRWLVFGMMVLFGLVVILSFGWLYLDQQQKSLSKEIDNYKQQLAAQNLEQTKKDAAEISGDVKVISQVLSREIRFSVLIQDIGKIMPQGTILSSLTLAKIDGAVDLSTNSLNYNAAAQVAVNLNDPKNELFDKVDIVTINCDSAKAGLYKCTGTYKALFSKSAQTRYLSFLKDSKP